MPTFKIAVTGPEGSGKTVLAMALAKYFSCPLVIDYADHYLNRVQEVSYPDLLKIGKGKIQLENEILTHKPPFLVSDNELISLKIWAEYRFIEYSQELKKIVDSQYYDLYILTTPSNTIKEPFRREDPSLRNYFYNAYKKELDENKLPYIIVEGEFYQRKKEAVRTITKMANIQG